MVIFLVFLNHSICALQVTYADFAVYVLLECLIPEMPSPLSISFPHLAHLMEGVQSLERCGEREDSM